MSTRELNAYERTARRTRLNEMEVTLLGDDLAEVVNLEHGTDSDSKYEHTYLVQIDEVTEEPTKCSCPHHTYRNAYCKHMGAVKGALVDVDDPDTNTDAENQAVTDGGPETCQNGTEGCCGPDGDDLPCFECSTDTDPL